MKIKLRDSNFIKVLKKGGVLVLTVSMLSNYTGCTMLDNPESNQSVIESTITTNGNLLPEVENELYDFKFLEPKEEVVDESKRYDWEETMDKLLEKEETIYDLFKPRKNYCHYGIAMYLDIDANGNMSNYYRIVDNNGNYIGDKIPFERILIQSLDERNSIIILGLNYGVGAANSYVIFDHATGKSKYIETANLKSCGNYMIKTIYEDGNYYYQLLYQNGNLASEDKYSNIVMDDKTGYMYLSSEDEKGQLTKVLNPDTGKYIEFEGKTLDVYNNYIIFQNYKNGYNYAGVYHLEDIKKSLIKKIDNNYNSVCFIKRADIPLIVCSKDSKSTLATAEGNIIAGKYDNIKKESDYFIVYETYDMTEEKRHVISLINEDGEKIIDKVEASGINHIPGTNKVIFQQQGLRGNYGIMDFDKNIIIEPEYDFLGVYNNTRNPEQFAIYGHKNKDKYVETYVFDNNFSEITHGFMHEIVVYEVVEKYYNEKFLSKQKTIGTNNN